MNGQEPHDLSVVVASQDAEVTIEACLESLTRQSADRRVEIVVVDDSRDKTPRLLQTKFAGLQVYAYPRPALVPELWSYGAERSSGRIVAFTTGHCVPAANWIDAMLRHHDSQHAAVGGAIENLTPSSRAQWAMYFLRYAPYMLPFRPHAARQIPGDNASYKRWVLERHASLITNGFWESIVNDQLHHDGHSLFLTPDAIVDHGRSFGTFAFCRQRFIHGRKFGGERIAASSPLKRMVYVSAAPLIPLVFIAKIARQVVAKRRHGRAFVESLPMLILFVLCWSFGEFAGYVQPRSEGRVGS